MRTPWLPGVPLRLAAASLALLTVAGGVVAGNLLRGALAAEPTDARIVLVRSTPEGAAVDVDGARAGMTPVIATVRLADGAHQIKVTPMSGGKPSGTPVVRKVVLKRNDRVLAFRENLTGMGKVIIETRPQGAQLFLDGAEVGMSPLTLEKLSTEKIHVVEARRNAHVTQTATVPMDRGDVHRLRIPLLSTQGEGSLLVQSSPPAELRVDGEVWAKLGDRPRRLASGLHEVTLMAPGLTRPATFTVDVPPRGVARYFFELAGR